MWANKRTLVALNTLFRTPYRYGNRRPTFLKRRSAKRECAILHAEELRDLELIAFLAVHDILDFGDEFRRLLIDRHFLIHSVFPFCGHIDSME